MTQQKTMALVAIAAFFLEGKLVEERDEFEIEAHLGRQLISANKAVEAPAKSAGKGRGKRGGAGAGDGAGDGANGDGGQGGEGGAGGEEPAA